jgi:predicted enzyme related to lactoylglutathione lyase
LEGRVTSDARPSVHVSIDVPRLDEGVRFYGAVFAFVETARPFPTMAILDANNVTVCMHEKAAGTRSSIGGTDRRYERHWTPVHLDLHVADLDAVLDKVRAEGGAVENELRSQGPKAVAFCSDPFGNGFCVIAERGSSGSQSVEKPSRGFEP